MNFSDSDIKELQILEESLWRPETRFDFDYMNNLLADDFFEFGRSGKIYTKTESLSAPMQEIHAKLPLRDFTAHQMSNDVVLVTYISEVQYETLEVGNRSSFWLKTQDGWRLKFHQGTPTN